MARGMFEEAVAHLLAQVQDRVAAVQRGEMSLRWAAAELGMRPSELERIYRAQVSGNEWPLGPTTDTSS